MEANESLDVFLLFTKLNPVNNNTTLHVIYFGQLQPETVLRCEQEAWCQLGLSRLPLS